MTETTTHNASCQPTLQAALQQAPTFARELAAGGIAGGIAKTCVAPLERIKILFQTGKVSNLGVPGTLALLWRNEGVAGLFRGNTASVLRIVPYAAVHFGTYESYRRLLVEHVVPYTTGITGTHDVTSTPATSTIESGRPPRVKDHIAASTNAGSSEGAIVISHPSKKLVHPVWDLLAGSASGATAVMLTYPLDVVRTRLAWATETAVKAGQGVDSHFGNSHQKSIRGVLTHTFKTEGVTGLYKGVSPTVLGILPYAGLKFYVYQSSKNWYKQVAADGHKEHSKLPMHLMLLFGGVSGLLAQTITYPLDVVRRRMQVHGLSLHTGAQSLGPSAPLQQSATTLGLLKSIVQQEGYKGLFRGLSINYMKVVPSTAIGFTIYDGMKSYLDLDNNL